MTFPGSLQRGFGSHLSPSVFALYVAFPFLPRPFLSASFGKVLSTLKDVYQGSKISLPGDQCQAYPGGARKSFEHSLRLDPNNASARNGMGNVVSFEGHLGKEIKEIEIALKLTSGNCPDAEHDGLLVTRVKNGEIPFAF